MTLISIERRLSEDFTITCAGEQLTEHFAITTSFYKLPDGSWGVTSGPVLAHIPSGLAVTNDRWLNHKVLAAELEKLPIDWANMVKPTADDAKLFREAIRRVGEMGHDDEAPWPAWAGDESTPALSLLAEQLDSHLESDFWQRARDISKALAGRLGLSDAKIVDAHLDAAAAIANTSHYGIIYLLAVLHRIDPAAADTAARELVADWESGDQMGEMAHEWRQQLAEGVPLTLHRFPELSFIDGGAA